MPLNNVVWGVFFFVVGLFFLFVFCLFVWVSLGGEGRLESEKVKQRVCFYSTIRMGVWVLVFCWCLFSNLKPNNSNSEN